MSKYVLGNAYEPKVWKTPMSWPDWREAVVGLYHAPADDFLKALFAERWEPEDLQQHLMALGWFDKKLPRRKYARVLLDKQTVENRLAVTMYLACSRLLARNMTQEARDYINVIYTQAGKVAGIIQ